MPGFIQPGVKTSMGRYIEFGKYVLNKHELDKNFLQIKYKNLTRIMSLPKTKVSDDFGKVILRILKDKLVDYEILKTLSVEEQNLFTKVIITCGLKSELDYTAPKNEPTKDLIEQFNIIRGEIISGNDNKELLDKASIVVQQLMDIGKISNEEGNEILLELKGV